MADDIVTRLRVIHCAADDLTPCGTCLPCQAADEIERLQAERDAERDVARMRVRAEMARRGLLRTQLSPWFDPDTETVVVPYTMNSEIARAWEFLAWLDNETEARRER